MRIHIECVSVNQIQFVPAYAAYGIGCLDRCKFRLGFHLNGGFNGADFECIARLSKTSAAIYLYHEFGWLSCVCPKQLYHKFVSKLLFYFVKSNWTIKNSPTKIAQDLRQFGLTSINKEHIECGHSMPLCKHALWVGRKRVTTFRTHKISILFVYNMFCIILPWYLTIGPPFGNIFSIFPNILTNLSICGLLLKKLKPWFLIVFWGPKVGGGLICFLGFHSETWGRWDPIWHVVFVQMGGEATPPRWGNWKKNTDPAKASC